MQPCSLEWAAGLFEGEGCITTNGSRTYRCPRLALTMSDEDVVRRFAEVVGLPYYIPHKSNTPNRKPCWTWRTAKRVEVIRILSALLPYFGNRRAYKALTILDQLELAL
jgi:hypothetical protein